MENGNIETSWLSKHVRPVLALLSFVVFSVLAATVVLHVVDKGGEMEWVAAILGLFAMCFLYYFNVRAQDKALERFMGLVGKFNTNPLSRNIAPHYDTPHTYVCQCPECVGYGHAPSCQCVECKGGSESTVPFEGTPFDRRAFLEVVDASVQGMYGTVNACTRLYTAQSKAMNVWKFDNIKARRDCADLLIELGETAFKEIWGVSIDYAEKHLNDESGCTTCGDKARGCTYPDLKFKARQLGMHYYAVLLELERLYRNRADLG